MLVGQTGTSIQRGPWENVNYVYILASWTVSYTSCLSDLHGFRDGELVTIQLVAERISYFCLARNLIRPLRSTHIFTQSGWLILFFPDHLSGQHKLGKPPNTLSSLEFLRSGQTSYCLLFNSSSISITPPWGKPSNLWTPCVA